ncbi:WxL domain-containing protein [Vagococcus hydrophili]|uniref:WxL domain-containing protein n=1 Tax=Vagococcus hydrophili TaxID=2714947 RepID=A0A6G8ARE8_9ENTE|nr:WxL domain-containing protein [Vagococcus hydrophili]QIL47503.1 WxL domain-containing protein [Vagococcus hydrophili]
MKFTTKSASVLLAILAASTIGGTIASAADAKELESTGTVIVDGDGDTGGPDTDGKIPDPEKEDPTKPTDPETVDPNPNKGPLKVELVSKLNFGKIAPKAGEIKTNAAPIKTEAGDRGALIQFADVRSDVYGYVLQAKMSQQFTSGSNVLSGSTITYNNGIAKPETDNTNTPGSFVKSGDIVLGAGEDDKTFNSVEVFKADAAKKEGKGRYTLEFGQSKDYQAPTGVIGTGTPDTADKAVQLTIPNKTASNMAKGTYESKVTWSLVTAP